MILLDSLPGGRASFALPRAILRVEAEKAGAGMCRLGFFGQDAFTGMGFPRRLDQKRGHGENPVFRITKKYVPLNR